MTTVRVTTGPIPADLLALVTPPPRGPGLSIDIDGRRFEVESVTRDLISGATTIVWEST